MDRDTRVRVECEALPPESEVVELEGREGLSQGFEFDVLVAARQGLGPSSDEVVGSAVSIVFETTVARPEVPTAFHRGETWYELRRVHGLVCECDDVLLDDEVTTYRLRIVPASWQSTLVETLDIFMDKSVPDIVRTKLANYDLTEGEDFELRVDPARYPVHEFVVQYKERDHAFISRLCEHHGIFTFHEAQGDRTVLVFADENGACTPSGDVPEVPFVGRGDRRGVLELRSRTRLTPKVFVQRDYNYRTPQADLTAMAENDLGFGGGVIEYGGHFKDADEGNRLAEVRAQERKAARQVLSGRSTVGSFGAGTTCTIVGHPRGERAVLVTEVLHHARQTTFLSGGDEATGGYHNEFLAIPLDLPFRPPRTTPRPRVAGFLTGVIDGPDEGKYAEVDDQGRYRVKFMFDTNETGEGKASRVVRMMQPHAGAGYGMHFPLRVGTEVLITFFDGDPDRPIIAGTVPNPLTGSPVRAENKTHNVLRTGGGNEIDMADDEDNQRVKITSPFGTSVVQIGQSNEPENGVALATMNNLTSTAGGAHTALSSMHTNWNSFNDTWSCHITDYAGPTLPLARLQWGIDSFKAVGVMVSGLTGAVLSIRDFVAAQQRQKLDGELADLGDKTKARDEARTALSACLAGVNREALSAEQKAKLDRLGAAIAAHEKAQADLGAAAQTQAEAEAAKAELEAGTSGALTQAVHDQALEAAKADVADAKDAVADARDVETDAKDELDEALDAVADDPALGGLSCGEATLADDARDLKKKNDAHLAARSQAETTADEVTSTEESLKGAKETKDWADGVVAAADAITTPLYSLITTIWGTGMQGLARNVADFMLQEALVQYDPVAFPALIPTPKMQFDIKQPPLFINLVPTVVEPRQHRAYGVISRLDWKTPFRTNTEMKPGGGAGLKNVGALRLALIPVVGPFLAYRYNSKAQGAFQEARNIQGSEAHAAVFGQTSALVSGHEHAALTSAKNVVVTANDQVEVHSRGTTEIAGGEVYVSATKGAEIVSRGAVLIKTTGPADGTTPDASPARFIAPRANDVDRAKVEMKRGKLEASVLHKTTAASVGQLTLEASDATDLGTATLQTGTGDQFLKLAGAAAPAGQSITAETPGTLALKGDKVVDVENSKWKLKLDQGMATLGDDTTYVGLQARKVAMISADDANFAGFEPGGVTIEGAKLDVVAKGNLTIDGTKILLG
jgi:type VI secretion system secreted protein VgrG